MTNLATKGHLARTKSVTALSAVVLVVVLVLTAAASAQANGPERDALAISTLLCSDFVTKSLLTDIHGLFT